MWNTFLMKLKTIEKWVSEAHRAWRDLHDLTEKKEGAGQ